MLTALFCMEWGKIATAQEFPVRQDWQWITTAVPGVVRLQEPLEYVLPLVFLGGAAASFFWDSAAVVTVQQWRSPEVDAVMTVAKGFGEGGYWALGSLLLYGIGGMVENASLREIGRDLFVTLVLTGGVTVLGKMVFGRARPFTHEGPRAFHWFQIKEPYLSLPSGHTATAFALAAYAARKIDQWWSYTLFLPIAALTGISRMYHNKHWLSDVLGGAAVGTWIGFAIGRESRESHAKSKLTVTPLLPYRVAVQVRLP